MRLEATVPESRGTAVLELAVLTGAHIPAHLHGKETPAPPRFPGCPSALAPLLDPGRTTPTSP